MEDQEYKQKMQEKKERRRQEGESNVKMVPPRVAICIPSNDYCNIEFNRSYVNMCLYSREAIKGLELALIGQKGILIDFNRCLMVQEALKSQCTHILFIDTDMTFPHDTLFRLLVQRKDVIGCNCSSRVPPIKTLATNLDGSLVTPEQQGVFEVSRIGTGVMLISTQVFTKLEAPWFDCLWKSPYADDKLDEGLIANQPRLPGQKDIGVYYGEDLYFCDKVRKTTPYKIWVDNDLSKRIGHQGLYTVYPTREWMNFTIDHNGNPVWFDSLKPKEPISNTDYGWIKDGDVSGKE